MKLEATLLLTPLSIRFEYSHFGQPYVNMRTPFLITISPGKFDE